MLQYCQHVNCLFQSFCFIYATVIYNDLAFQYGHYQDYRKLVFIVVDLFMVQQHKGHMIFEDFCFSNLQPEVVISQLWIEIFYQNLVWE